MARQSDRIDGQSTAKSQTRQSNLRVWLQTYRKQFKYLDRGLIGLSLSLIIIGLVMVFSSTMYVEDTGVAEPWTYLFKQTIAAIGGGIIGAIVLAVPLEWLRNRWLLLGANLISLVGLIITLYQTPRGGATSWLHIGSYSLQVSEFSKYLMVILFAYTLTTFQVRFRNWRSLPKPDQKILGSVVALIAMSLLAIFKQPDLGMVLISLGALMIVWLVDRTPLIGLWRTFIGLGVFYLLVYWGAVNYSDWLINRNHQLQRIGIFVNPFNYPLGAGYQLIHSYLAISHGGWFGVGIGNSIAKEINLPAAHTDFIFAIIVEELGFVGGIFILGLLMALVIRIFILASRTRNDYHQLLMIGIGGLLLMQTLTNIGGIIGLIPLTGVTLPFVSYGGSSLATSMIAVALVQRLVIADRSDDHYPPLSVVHRRHKER